MEPDELIEMPFLRNVGLVCTYKCQVACPHCIIEAGPHRTEEMSIDEACCWIDEIADYRDGFIGVLSLTGGEPFYSLERLKKLGEFGDTRGLLVSAVTNAFWARTQEQAVETLRSLPFLKMLAISTDVYHQLSIPFERVRNAILAARECGVPYNVAVCTTNESDEKHRTIVNMLLTITEAETIATAVTFPAGRALKRLNPSEYCMVDEPPKSACSAGSSPIIFPDGRVIACIGPVIDISTKHPLLLGNLRREPLAEILDRAEVNPILHAIRIWGPRKLIGVMQEAGLHDHLPEKYIKDSVCNACYWLMSNETIVQFLEDLALDQEFQEKIAYARIFYLNEPMMAELLELIDT